MKGLEEASTDLLSSLLGRELGILHAHRNFWRKLYTDRLDPQVILATSLLKESRLLSEQRVLVGQRCLISSNQVGGNLLGILFFVHQDSDGLAHVSNFPDQVSIHLKDPK